MRSSCNFKFHSKSDLQANICLLALCLLVEYSSSFWSWRSEVEIRMGRWSKDSEKYWHVRASICDVNWRQLAIMQGHASDLKCSWSTVISLYPSCQRKPIGPRSNLQPGIPSSLEFLLPAAGTGDVILAVSSSPELFWPFSTVCLTVLPLKFWPRTFNFELYEKSLQDQRLWFWSSFPWRIL